MSAAAADAPFWPAEDEEKRRARVLQRFDTFDVNDEQREGIGFSRTMFKSIARSILQRTKPGREQSLALTALEEAKYWTNQSIAKDGVPA